MRQRSNVLVAAVVVLLTAAATARSASDAMVRIPAGSYAPLFRGTVRDSLVGPLPPRKVAVPAFELDVRPVSNAEFLAFVGEHPAWRRSRVKPLFADKSYLHHWKDDLDLGDPSIAGDPVVNVSWFAARAYAAARGKRLPTVDEWEYAAAASATKRDASDDEAFQNLLRTWYAKPTPARLVGAGFRNFYGVEDMHGLVWEWTLDFNSALISGESRGDGAIERTLYCGSGAAGAADFRNYAAFMRFAFRSSLEARYAVANLGFRCARDIPGPKEGH